MLSEERSKELISIAREVRKDVVRMIGLAKVGCLESSLALADLLVYLYWEALSVDPSNPRDLRRDRFILSKRRAAPVLYAVLARRGFFSREELWSFGRLGALLQGNPEYRRIPGLDAPSGPSGMGLGMAVGLSMSLQMDKMPCRTFCLMGDGELRDGTVWEAAFSASFRRLGGLVAVINVTDHGKEQWGPVDSVDTIKAKLESFGWTVAEGDGHDFMSMDATFRSIMGVDSPKAVILRTREAGGVLLPGGSSCRGPLSREDVDVAISSIESDGRRPSDERT
ncbi:transketolase, beta subunit [Thermanaerovibrio velox DSM 12556]|uniref:Transketolase, beta subunit n=1 Tax=Thermanaerovibrio velox DSM 12556 TaxID=926567 RepID=H0UNM6_9BACT|nr:transketolase [Thermanaerovibrio velox]EHM10441.1 transketolase, beta subunit [Thermanaerovibrio velox DSM 12556]